MRYFVFHTVRFIYSHARRTFEPVPAIPPSFSAEMGAARQAVGAGSTPYSPSPLVRQRRGVLYGTNLLEVGRSFRGSANELGLGKYPWGFAEQPRSMRKGRT